MYNHYNKNLKHYARNLRSNSVSKAEKCIWKSLLSRSQMGIKFKRQRPIGTFIVDFYAQEVGLIIEIDGSSHSTKGSYDKYRQNNLESLGYTVVRLKEGEVLNDLNQVQIQLNHVIYCLKEDA